MPTPWGSSSRRPAASAWSGYHLARGQGITSLDLLALAFAIVNLVLYFALDNTWLIEHVAVVFYTLLALQCAVSLVRGDPWTTQFTRRVVTPEFAHRPDDSAS